MKLSFNGFGVLLKDYAAPVIVVVYLLVRLDGQILHLIRTADEINARLLVHLTEGIRVPHR